MKYKCVVNTHLKNHALKAGDMISQAQLESAGDANLQSLLKAGFVVEVGSEESAPVEAEVSDEPMEESEEHSEEPSGKKKKGKK